MATLLYRWDVESDSKNRRGRQLSGSRYYFSSESYGKYPWHGVQTYDTAMRVNVGFRIGPFKS